MKKIIILLSITYLMNSAFAQNTTQAPAPASNPPRVGVTNPASIPLINQGDFLGQNQTITPNIKIHRGDFSSINIPSNNPFQYIQKLVVVLNGNGKVELFVNGHSKGFMEGSFWSKKSQIFNVDEFASSVEFRHVDGSRVIVRKLINLPVLSTCLPYFYERRPCLGPYPVNPVQVPGSCLPNRGNCGPIVVGGFASASQNALQGLIALSQQMSYIVGPEDLAHFIMPVRIKSTEAISIGRARGTASGDYRNKILEVITDFDNSMKLMDQLQQIETNASTAALWIQYGEILKHAVQ